MKTPFFAALALAVASAGSGYAGTIYNNTTTDTLVTYFYSTGPYTQIGDSISLGGTDRTLTDATVQFFNNGTAGTFTATLSFWNVGAPVGSQIGSSYVLNLISMNQFDILNVTYSSLNLLVPNNLVFTIDLSNVSNNTMDVGLNAFEAPSVGSSNNAQIITGSPFATGLTTAGEGNLYLRLEATTVPEPATITMAGAAMLALLAARRRAVK